MVVVEEMVDGGKIEVPVEHEEVVRIGLMGMEGVVEMRMVVVMYISLIMWLTLLTFFYPISYNTSEIPKRCHPFYF